MQRNFKVPSKILKQLETERENKRLYLELNTIKPTMSLSLPRDCSHLKINKKRDQLREDRYTEIERENRILLEKINTIIQNRQNKIYRPQIKNSLNFPVRARHQREISMQNLGLLKRLQSKKSFYSFGGSIDRSHRKNKKSEQLSPCYSRNSEIFGGKKKLLPLNKEKLVVYSTKINLKDNIFAIEVVKGKNVKVIAENEQTHEKFVLELSKNEAKEIIGAEENWKRLVEFLHLEGNDLIMCGEASSESI